MSVSLSLRGRAFWSFADQGLSSLTNAALSIVVARAVGQDAFGAFSLALVTFSFAVGIGRAIIGDIYVIQFSGLRERERRRPTSDATGAALALGLFAALLCVVAAALLPDGETEAALLALALAFPGLLVQDCYRFVFFAAGRPAAATLNDFVWAVVQFAAVGALIATGNASVFAITLAWGAGALVAAMLGAVQAQAVPALNRARDWFVTHRGLNVRMGLDYALNMSSVHLATYVIGAIVGLAGVGAIRAAQVLLGPLLLLTSGIAAFVLPVLSTRVSRGRPVRRFAALASLGMTAVSAVWVAVLLLIPDHWGVHVLGESWDGARSVLVGCSIVSLFVASTTGPSLALRALRQPGRLLRVTLIQSPLILGLGVLGAFLDGPQGAVIGFAVAQGVGALALWFLFVRTPEPDEPVADGPPEQPAAFGLGRFGA